MFNLLPRISEIFVSCLKSRLKCIFLAIKLVASEFAPFFFWQLWKKNFWLIRLGQNYLLPLSYNFNYTSFKKELKFFDDSRRFLIYNKIWEKHFILYSRIILLQSSESAFFSFVGQRGRLLSKIKDQ